MRLFEKIKKFFELPEQCSTCRYWEPLYNKFGICKRYDSPYCQPLKKNDHICQLYERRDK